MTDFQSGLPSGWAWTTLGEIQIDDSKTINPGKLPGQMFELYSVPSFDTGKPELIDGATVGSSKRVVEPETVLLCKINPRINRVWIVRDHSPYPKIASTEWIPFFPVEGILPGFLAYYLCTEDVRRYLSLNVSGVGGSLMRIRPSEVTKYPFPLAPLNEQRRIVEAIESYFTRLDAAEAALRRAQAKLTQYKTALLKAACEGRLVPTEAELARQEGRDYEPADNLLARILEERRTKWEAEEWTRLVERAKQRGLADARKAAEQAPGEPLAEAWLDVPEAAYKKYLPKDDKWKERYQYPAEPDTTDLPELPEGWCWATVDHLGNVQLGRQRSPKNHQGPYMRPYLRAANATWDGLNISDVAEMNFSPDDFERYQLHVGDILLSEASGSPNEVGKSFIWRGEIDGCCFQNTLIRVQTFGLPPEYLQLHFLKDAKIGRFGQIAKGVGIHHLSGQRLAVMAVALPPLAEQHAIVNEYERRSTVIKVVESTLGNDLKRLAKTRQSILQRAYAGELTHQSAEDEPADMLLQRIRAEREAQVAVKTKSKTKKPSAKKTMSRETVLQTIEQMPQDTFTFDQLRDHIAGNYETLRDILFELLGETPPSLNLKFDSEQRVMMFVRGQK